MAAKNFSIPVWVRLVVCATLLGLVISRLHFSEAVRVTASASLPLIGVVVLLHVLFISASAVRWFFLLRCLDGSISFFKLLRVTFGSVLIGIVTPGTVGYEISRIIGVSRANVTFTKLILSTALDRVLGAMALALVVLCGLVLNPKLLRWEVVASALGLVFVIAAALICIANLRVQRFFFRLLPGRLAGMFGNKLSQLNDCIRQYRQHPFAMAGTLLTAVGSQWLRVLTIAVAARALGLEVPFLYLAVIVPLISFLAMLPVTIVGIGVSEATYIYFLGMVGVAKEGAFALSMLNLLTFIVAVLPGALALVLPAQRAEKKQTIPVVTTT